MGVMGLEEERFANLQGSEASAAGRPPEVDLSDRGVGGEELKPGLVGDTHVRSHGIDSQALVALPLDATLRLDGRPCVVRGEF